MEHPPSPFTLRNIRLFIAFRIFFNARFYYPVFTILFLDFGLSIEQFALLNTVWAITIVCAEVPSGALADVFSRKTLIVLTSLLMVLEMALLAFIPLGNMELVFWAFLLNRVLSGLAEAMASGADEAIAYDTLVAQGNPDHWPKVLSVQMRWRSIASIISMTVGALVYDPKTVNHLLGWFNSSWAVLQQQDTMRFPIYLTLGLALLATASALRLEDTKNGADEQAPGNLRQAFILTWEAGRWIARTPFALAIILFGMCYDHSLRMIVTMTSQYFRLIDLPEASFGLIGSAIGLIGLLVPKVAESMVERFTAAQNTLLVALVSLAGLLGLTLFIPYFGLLPMALIFAAMMLVSFFSSHYLNQVTSSRQRATVLSFKGLAFNLAYGLIGFFFAMLMTSLRQQLAEPGLDSQVIENLAFQQAIGWFPGYTLLCLALVTLFCWYRARRGQTISP